MIRRRIEPRKVVVASDNRGVAGLKSDKEEDMQTSRWAGWIGFAGWLMIIIGTLDFFEGLIAVIRGQYYVLTPNQIVVFDLRTWGWITLFWGIVVGLAGLGLLSGGGWA